MSVTTENVISPIRRATEISDKEIFVKRHFQNPETAVIHAGQEPDTLYGGVSVPIYQSATFAFRWVAKPTMT